MACVYHPEREEVAACALCERALCRDCTHHVQDKVYCERCLAERMGMPAGDDTTASGDTNAREETRTAGTFGAAGDTGAADDTGTNDSIGPKETLGGESPGAAFAIGLLPGVGAIYNAEYFKAAAHIVIFALLIRLADNGSDMFGFLAFGFYCYMPFEAYYTAKKRLLLRQGVDLATPFDRINEEFDGMADKDWWGGVALIGMGVLFLLDNLRILDLDQVLQLWPAVLIVIGVWLLRRFHREEA